MTDLFERLKTALADRYTIQRELGRGGMATVYLAKDPKHRRNVAIKVLHPELAAVLGADRFLREIELAAGLMHPHILPLHDSGQAGSFLFYVMPYVDGESLRDRLNRETQLSLDPFTGSTPQSILARKVTDTIPSLRAVRETVPEAFENVVLKALARSPADRFASATLFAEALRDPATVTPVRTSVVRMPRAAIGVVSVLALLAMAILLVLRQPATSLAVAQRQQLTFEGGVMNMALSPDGEMLAFTQYRCRDTTICAADLFVQDFPGGKPFQIAIAWADQGFNSTTESFSSIEWSPDGREILMTP